MSHDIRSRHKDGARHEIVLAGRLHADAEPALRAALDEAASQARVVILDVSGLESIDATALQAVVDLVKRVRPRGGEVVLFGVRPTVMRLLELTSVDRLVAVLATREDALATGA
jgi:anti-anti-sigma factor